MLASLSFVLIYRRRSIYADETVFFFVPFLEDFFPMSASEEFQPRRSDRKRKRDVPEEETPKMDTEPTPLAQFPPMDSTDLKVRIL